jgi:hypothetical protein
MGTNPQYLYATASELPVRYLYRIAVFKST